MLFHCSPPAFWQAGSFWVICPQASSLVLILLITPFSSFLLSFLTPLSYWSHRGARFMLSWRFGGAREALRGAGNSLNLGIFYNRIQYRSCIIFLAVSLFTTALHEWCNERWPSIPWNYVKQGGWLPLKCHFHFFIFLNNWGHLQRSFHHQLIIMTSVYNIF